jgi:predicted extracellular nuclease
MGHHRFACITFLVLITLLVAQPLIAISPNIVISQIYGGGGNTGATYKNDDIELYNRGTSAVDVTGWSVQYYDSATGTSWQVTAISGTIPAGGYYLVKEAQGSGGTVDLPTPDATGSIAVSATAGKVALVRNSTALSGSCPSSTDIVDFVGYSTADCFEGTVAAALTNTTALIRASGGADTDNNAADFTTGAPNPHSGGLPSSPTSALARI